MKLTLCIAFLLFLVSNKSVCQETKKTASKPDVSIQLDFESAKAITNLLIQSKTTDPELDRIAKLYGSQQLIRKVTSYNKSGTETVFKQTLREIVETGTIKGNDPFEWKTVKGKLTEIRQLIDQLATKTTFVEEVKNRILPYSPPNINASVRACFLVGGGSLGFTIGNDATFNVALQKIGDDYEGLLELVAHELYHSIQHVGDRNRIKEKPASAPPQNDCQYRHHAVKPVVGRHGKPGRGFYEN